LARTYTFKNYSETMAFVNATAWISQAVAFTKAIVS
jgi:pterin-4a-carbinolamine dehydratase